MAGAHPLSCTSVIPHSPSFPIGPVLLVLLQNTKPTLEMQKPGPLVPSEHLKSAVKSSKGKKCKRVKKK